MDPVALYHQMTGAIVVMMGGSDKFAHMNAGMAAYLIGQAALRTRRGSLDAFLAVLLLEAANEAMDRLYAGSWRWSDTLGDIAATLFWPAALLLTARYRRRRWRIDEARCRHRHRLGELMGMERVPAAVPAPVRAR
jgi:hypothetical protein